MQHFLRDRVCRASVMLNVLGWVASQIEPSPLYLGTYSKAENILQPFNLDAFYRIQ